SGIYLCAPTAARSNPNADAKVQRFSQLAKLFKRKFQEKPIFLQFGDEREGIHIIYIREIQAGRAIFRQRLKNLEYLENLKKLEN
ncbi:MAG: hypothetical protein IKP43_08065, partial [Bacteroidaceae bacterium]|nr:hypothetical protein [Bacteroidaceae bacterium]